MFAVPERDPSLTSDAALPPAVVPPACHPGAASSHAAAAAAAAAAAVTLPTGATAAAHRGTPSLGPAVAAGVGAAAPREHGKKPNKDISREEDEYDFYFDFLVCVGGALRAWTAAVRAAHREHL